MFAKNLLPKGTRSTSGSAHRPRQPTEAPILCPRVSPWLGCPHRLSPGSLGAALPQGSQRIYRTQPCSPTHVSGNHNEGSSETGGRTRNWISLGTAELLFPHIRTSGDMPGTSVPRSPGDPSLRDLFFFILTNRPASSCQLIAPHGA